MPLVPVPEIILQPEYCGIPALYARGHGFKCLYRGKDKDYQYSDWEVGI
jgi:hypothetical protein